MKSSLRLGERDSGHLATTHAGVAYTPQSDTALTLPTDWGNVSVAQGQLQASVAYEYTEAAAGGPELPATGLLNNPLAIVAIVIVLLGITALVVAQNRRRNHPSSDIQ